MLSKIKSQVTVKQAAQDKEAGYCIWICKVCSDTCHKTEDGRVNIVCSICKGKHLMALHDHITILGCSLAASVKLATLSMQDIEIRRGPRGLIIVRGIFDNGTKVTLVRNAFTMKTRNS